MVTTDRIRFKSHSDGDRLRIPAVVLSLALIFVGVEDGALWPDVYLVAMLAGVSVFLAFEAIRRHSAMDDRYLSVRSLLPSVFALHYALGGVLILVWTSFPWQSVVNADAYVTTGVRSGLGGACYIATVAGLGFYVGSSLTLRASSSSVGMIVNEYLLLKRAAPFLLLITLSLYLLVQPVVTLVWQQPVHIVASFSEVLIAFCAHVAVSTRDVAERVRFWLVCGVAVLLSALPVLSTGARENLLKPLLFVLIGYLTAKQRLPWRGVGAVLVLLVLVVLPVANVAKQYVFDRGLGGAELLYAARKDSSQANFSISIENVLSNLLQRINMLSSVSIYSQHYPSQFSWLNGESFVLELTEFVPRLAWPEKPEVGRLLDNYARSVGAIAQGDANTSAKFESVAEYYINFGLWGAFVCSCAHGMFYRLLECCFRRLLSPLMATLTIAVLFVENNDFFSFVSLGASHLKQLIIWSGLIMAISKVSTRKSRIHLDEPVQLRTVR